MIQRFLLFFGALSSLLLNMFVNLMFHVNSENINHSQICRVCEQHIQGRYENPYDDHFPGKTNECHILFESFESSNIITIRNRHRSGAKLVIA